MDRTNLLNWVLDKPELGFCLMIKDTSNFWSGINHFESLVAETNISESLSVG